MNEEKKRNPENIAPETAENKVQGKIEDNENVPGEKAAVPAKPAKKKKKRRVAKLALPVVAVLLVLALLFGVIVGYALGRNVGAVRLRDAEAQVAALTQAFEEAAAAPVYSQFSEELTGENQSALDELSGQGFANPGVSELAGEDALLSQVLEGGEQEDVVVAEYTGGKLMRSEVAAEYEDQMAGLVFSGYNEAEVAETLLNEVMKYMVSDRILEAKAREMGLYELTDADRADIEAEANKVYNEQMEFYRSFVNTSGMSEEEANGAVKSYLEQSEGVTLEGLRTEMEQGWWAQKMFDAITADVQLDDAQLQAAYDALLKEQKESFEGYAADFEFAQVNGETIVYNLPGYRAVRMLLFALEDVEALEAVNVLSEEIPELDPEKDKELIAQYQAEVDRFYAPAEERAEAALAELQAGADFVELLDTIGDDEGMRNAALQASGYYVSDQTLLWPAEMVHAAMALQKPGDISGAVRVGDGICILQYVGEVEAGEVPLADVKDRLAESALGNVRYAAYEARLNAWLEEAKVVYYPERMQ